MSAFGRKQAALMAAVTAEAEPAPPELGAAAPTSLPAGLSGETDERLLHLARYWRSIHPATGGLPGYQHFAASDVAALLPWLWLFEVHLPALRFRYRRLGNGHAFRYRFLGRAHADAMGRENTGLWLDEVRPNLRTEPAYDQFVAAVERRAVGYYKGRPTYPVGEGYVGIERLVLPLASDSRSVDMLLGITVYAGQGAAAG